ncbi:MAG: HypC/HybG/HupF family hydrogenase formation chaperone [Methanomassiliicoccaceae archaeon]|jgi:hydrogenase expression/formation protein HypC|nr:HypC/HybG/HupF family hydrogenase formation chaperone [Methanomassiliicoccaceae archaeon]
MCLALPGKIISMNDDTADIDFGGVIRKANITMVETKIGDWVVVHAGFAIEVMDEEEAMRTIELWNEVLAHDETDIR